VSTAERRSKLISRSDVRNRWKVAHHPLEKGAMRASLITFLALAILGSANASASSSNSALFPTTGPTIQGNRAALRDGIALAPSQAPLEVKRAIWAGNQLRRKPYRYGGGHRSFQDSAYDCSGTVSYALGGAGIVPSPMSSSDFRRFGARGQGKWITVYARNGHTFALIAGLRLDTTPYNTMRRDHNWAPRWQATSREPRGFEARHPAGL
jgi:hypothetical protein